jgi:transposase InsO family protein
MRFTSAEKQELIGLVERSDLGVRRTCQELGINRSSFYKWYQQYHDNGLIGLEPAKPGSRQQWNRIPTEERNMVAELALEHPTLSCRELSCKISDEVQVFISESSVYRILKERGLITTPAYVLMQAAPEFKQKTRFVHEMWQTDFTYFKIFGWGWYYLITILDDYSRFIIHWELCRNMGSDDVKKAIDAALHAAALKAGQKPPRLLSDNGPCFVSADLKAFLKTKDMSHTHGRPLHPQTQGKIERYHRSMKNNVKLTNYYCPDELNASIESFVTYYNYERYHESLENVTPSDVYYGRQEQILERRRLLKQKTFARRKMAYEKTKLNLSYP